MLKKITFTFALLFSISSNSQNIEIGRDAEDVKTIVEWTTAKNQKENRFNKKNDSDWTCNSKYENGQLTEVIQCYQNQYLIDFQVKADYCERFIMKNTKLQCTVKEFKNLNLDQVKQYFINNDYAKHKIDDFYFSDDFQFYYKFYTSTNNLASVEKQKVVLSDFSKKMQVKIKSKKDSIEKTNSEEAIKRILGKGEYSSDNIQIAQMKKDIEKDKSLSITDSVKEDLKIEESLLRRKVLSKPSPRYVCNESGIVVIQISVDKSGKVVNAQVSSSGTTSYSKCLLDEAKIAAMNTRWEAKADAPDIQIGKMVYTFKIYN